MKAALTDFALYALLKSQKISRTSTIEADIYHFKETQSAGFYTHRDAVFI
jgi:hypothetical protein